MNILQKYFYYWKILCSIIFVFCIFLYDALFSHNIDICDKKCRILNFDELQFFVNNLLIKQ